MKSATTITRPQKVGAVSNRDQFPFASEFVTNSKGQVSKVILNVRDYEHLLEALEDEGLRRAMRTARSEKPLSREAALKKLAE